LRALPSVFLVAPNVVPILDDLSSCVLLFIRLCSYIAGEPEKLMLYEQKTHPDRVDGFWGTTAFDGLTVETLEEDVKLRRVNVNALLALFRPWVSP
jgi:hypothetical protein